MPTPEPQSPSGPFSFPQVLRDELAKLRPGLLPDSPAGAGSGGEAQEKAELRDIYRRVAADPEPLSALCFSGGGIRSATFNLGVTQGLARLGLLGRFDYLSSVSGGGYIAGWLRSWMAREGSARVLEQLSGSSPKPRDPLCPEPTPIDHLREYSNYLSPKLGLFSADTWTLAAIVLRNLLLNWLVIVPLLAALVCLPQFCLLLVRSADAVPEALVDGLLYLALATAFFSSVSTHALRRHHAPPNTSQTYYLLRSVLPLYVSATLLATVGAFREDLEHLRLFLFLWCVVIPVMGWAFSALRRGEDQQDLPSRGVEFLALVGSGCVAAALLVLLTEKWRPYLLDRPALYVALAGPVILGIYLLGRALFVGLSSFSGGGQRGEADREWWARLSGWMLIAVVGWLSFSILVLWLGHWIELFRGGWRINHGLSLVGGGTGILVGLLGNKEDAAAEGGASKLSLVKKLLPVLAAPAFLVCLFLLLGQGTAWLGRQVTGLDVMLEISPFQNAASARTVQMDPDATATFGPAEALPFLAVPAALILLSLLSGLFVNVNRFSLHGMYRNRLVRAYLGASNMRRHPDPFTGFDAGDNLQLHEVWNENPETLATRPLPVINCAWNLVSASSERLAWQQRKAESFSMTPFYCGNFQEGYRRSTEYGGPNGVSVGTAVTISGAAANPNMGYHSSPLIAFLLTLFNGRLGAWLGNPREEGEKTYRLSSPLQAVRPLLAELFGMTDNRSPYVNLSDGGHFENLGLYEMVLRRCRFVVVCDAGQDAAINYDDLGNAIRKVRIDFGIPIEFEKKLRFLPKHEGGIAAFCAYGRIRYHVLDGTDPEQDGHLIYLKPALATWDRPDPQDVYSYARSSADFPHESTADQFFNEAQFESYRALGSFLIQSLAQGDEPFEDFTAFRESVENYLKGREG